MADEQELREIKQSLSRLEDQVKELSDRSKYRRSSLANFAIGFLIVTVVIFIAFNVSSYFMNLD